MNRIGIIGVFDVDSVLDFGEGEYAGKNCSDGDRSFFVDDEWRRIFVRLFEAEKLVLIGKDSGAEITSRYFSLDF